MKLINLYELDEDPLNGINLFPFYILLIIADFINADFIRKIPFITFMPLYYYYSVLHIDGI